MSKKVIRLDVRGDDEEFFVLLKKLEKHVDKIIKVKFQVSKHPNKVLLLCQQLVELERLNQMRKIRWN